MLKTVLYQVRINQGGYDSYGSYWGNGEAPLFYYETPDNQSDFFRASSREAAKRKLCKMLNKQLAFFR